MRGLEQQRVTSRASNRLGGSNSRGSTKVHYCNTVKELSPHRHTHQRIRFTNRRGIIALSVESNQVGFALYRVIQTQTGKLADDEKAGVVIRTAAENAGEQEIIREAGLLRDELERILEKAAHASCPSCMYKKPEGWIGRIMAVPRSELEAVITDDEAVYERSVRALPGEMKPLLRLYEEKRQSMRDCYRLGRECERASSGKIWLSSGAFLMIEPTEALTAIDVNSGKAVRAAGGKKKEEYFLKLNKEAALESAAQIRLRNLSGIIIVDFINMEEEASRNELMRYLQKQLDLDPVKCCAVDMTKLHLAEITRQRKEPPLKLGRNKCLKEAN